MSAISENGVDTRITLKLLVRFEVGVMELQLYYNNHLDILF